MRDFLLAVLFVGLGVLVSILGLLLVRRKTPPHVMQKHHDVAGFLFGVLGVTYAVLMGFSVFLVWDELNEVKNGFSRETDQAVNLMQMSHGLPPGTGSQVRQRVRAYAELVINDEWRAMGRGEISPKVQAALEDLWRVYNEFNPATPRETVLYERSLFRLNEMTEQRGLRLRASHSKVPGVLWLVLYAGGLLTIGFTYFFGLENARAHVMMTAALAAQICLVLFLIAVMEHPFRGDFGVNPEEMHRALRYVEATAIP